MVANFWRRPGHAHSAVNLLQFLDSALHPLGDKRLELVRADTVFDETVLTSWKAKAWAPSCQPE